MCETIRAVKKQVRPRSIGAKELLTGCMGSSCDCNHCLLSVAPTPRNTVIHVGCMIEEVNDRDEAGVIVRLENARQNAEASPEEHAELGPPTRERMGALGSDKLVDGMYVSHHLDEVLCLSGGFKRRTNSVRRGSCSPVWMISEVFVQQSVSVPLPDAADEGIHPRRGQPAVPSGTFRSLVPILCCAVLRSVKQLCQEEALRNLPPPGIRQLRLRHDCMPELRCERFHGARRDVEVSWNPAQFLSLLDRLRR
mmetsp:Transcript_49370/g.143115  ORF Transcript_49370/g.143115 Transcript_49370/m.143115 type:complete len:252 (-) Transcript_49370:714-1469(-)